MATIHFPKNSDELSKELLTEVLQPLQPGIQVTGFSLPEINQCGDGKASTADRLQLEMQYAGQMPENMPGRVMLKTMLVSPHAPCEMYENEVRFYRDIRPGLELETPHIYAADFDAETGQFGLIMEDLTQRGIIFPNATHQLSVDQIKGILRTLAKLHGLYWPERNGVTLEDSRYKWLSTHVQGGMNNIFREHGFALVADQVDKHPFKQELIAPLNLSLDQMWQSLCGFQDEVVANQPLTLLHGDTHIANTYLLPESESNPESCDGGLYDWQLIAKGCWAHDVGYVITTGLTTEQRRQHEKELLTYYLDLLAQQNLGNLPDENTAWDLYRRSIMWGLFIGWLITPPSNYGEQITSANIAKLVNACLDLESFN